MAWAGPTIAKTMAPYMVPSYGVRVDAEEREPAWLRALRGLSLPAALAPEVAALVTSALQLRADRIPPPGWPTTAQVAQAVGPAARISAQRAVNEMTRLGVPDELMRELFGAPEPRSLSAGVIDVMTSPVVSSSIDAWADQAFGYIIDPASSPLGYIQAEVQSVVKRGGRWEVLAEEFSERVSATKARLVARDQVAKLNQQITEGLQVAAGVEEYFWVASDDERTRETHRAAARGGPYRWGDLSQGAGAPDVGFYGERGHPGQAGNCRCTARPVAPSWWDDLARTTRADALAIMRERAPLLRLRLAA